ncbi:cation channel family protein (macronuclear) [Tetrahymena thermophila SB210]|uniref:Cation channel family protein n=1 Tax=Tetrahymena thermophila (strain SB210) TaxID=312017 RepID=Q22CS4_TETTS|nr:cation channel family protein [Tetrahymena thermophila SB210]EAR83114.2 cation channel family protein [Tetrahymena thermophila SB210]|eukprot:XP_001030777.2 cation channel family protein [Tetrahymena thermophila SB210]
MEKITQNTGISNEFQKSNFSKISRTEIQRLGNTSPKPSQIKEYNIRKESKDNVQAQNENNSFVEQQNQHEISQIFQEQEATKFIENDLKQSKGTHRIYNQSFDAVLSSTNRENFQVVLSPNLSNRSLIEVQMKSPEMNSKNDASSLNINQNYDSLLLNYQSNSCYKSYQSNEANIDVNSQIQTNQDYPSQISRLRSFSKQKTRNQHILQQIKQFRKQAILKNNLTNFRKLDKTGKNSTFIQQSNNNNLQNNQIIQGTPATQNHLVILLMVKKFINSLLYFIAARDYKLLLSKHFNIIQDKSYIEPQRNKGFEEQFENQKTLLETYDQFRKLNVNQTFKKSSQILEKLKIILNSMKNWILGSYLFQLRVFQPNSLILILWDIFILIQLFVLYVLVPPLIAFGKERHTSRFYIALLQTLPLIIFLTDIFISFHSGYYEYGFTVLDKKQVTIKYLKTKFISDFICVLLIFLEPCDYCLVLALILKISQFKRNVQKLNEHFQIQQKYSAVYDLVILILSILYVSHLFGSGFVLISINTQNNPQGCWLQQFNIIDKDWQYQYIYAVYFTIITMITIGYGDIFPVNIFEKIYVIFMTFITCGLFAYCLNCIGEIFRDLKQKSQEFKQNQYILSNYLNRMNIQNNLKVKFLKYTEYIYHATDQLQTKGQCIFDGCPQEMKEEVLRDYYGKKILNYKYLRLQFSKQFLSELSLKMKDQSFGPGESLVVSGQKLQRLYFIDKGNDLEYYYSNQQLYRSLSNISLNEPYQLLDLGLFFTEQPADISVRTKTPIYASFILIQDFIETIQHFQNDYEKYQMMKHQFLFQSKQITSCTSCGAFSHNISKCPQIHYVVQKQPFALKLSKNQSQVRDYNYKRKFFKRDEKFHSLSLNQTVRYELKRIRLHYANQMSDFINDIEILQELQYSSNDKFFFMNVPQIVLQQNNLNDDESSIKEMNKCLNIFKYNQPSEYQFLTQSTSSNHSSNVSVDEQQEENDQKNKNFRFINKEVSIEEELKFQSFENQKSNLYKEEDIQDISDEESNMKPIDKVYVQQKILNTPNLNLLMPFTKNGVIENINQNQFDDSPSKINNFNKSSYILHANHKSCDIDFSENQPNNELIREKRLSHLFYDQSPWNNQSTSFQNLEKKQANNSIRKRLKTQFQVVSDLKVKSQSQINDGKSKDNEIQQQPQMQESTRIQSQSFSKNVKIQQEVSRQRNTSGNRVSSLQNIEGPRLSFMQNNFKISNQSIKFNEPTHLQRFQSSNDQKTMFSKSDKENNQSDFGHLKDQHIFGKMKFNFDKLKEYQIFFPHYNYTRIVKLVKKKNVIYNLKNLINNNSFILCKNKL